jgi:hypothetical protein
MPVKINSSIKSPLSWAQDYRCIFIVIRALLHLLRLLRIPTFILGRRDDPRGRSTPVHNGKFASFMSVQGRCSRQSDRHDRRLQLQKLTRAVAVVAVTLSAGWIAVESAKALSFF